MNKTNKIMKLKNYKKIKNYSVFGICLWQQKLEKNQSL